MSCSCTVISFRKLQSLVCLAVGSLVYIQRKHNHEIRRGQRRSNQSIQICTLPG